MSFRPPSRTGTGRPGSGFRTAAGNRPNTGFRRLDTASGQKPIGSRTVGLDTNVEIENRPITQHGMSGMQTKSSRGPSRKIADRNYYESLLKEKLVEIVREIDSMREQIKNYDSDKAEMSKLEKERAKLLNEVREYEGNLADYNLALDKLRSGADINTLQQTCQDIQRKNEQEKMRIDAIFLERKNLESQITQIQRNIDEIHSEMSAMLESNEHDQEIQDRFHALYGEFERTDVLISEKEKRLNTIQHRYHQIRENLSSNEYSFHLKALELQKQLNELNVTKMELQQETNGSMDAEQIKQSILDKVKADNKSLQETMDAINAVEDKMEELQTAIRRKEKELEGMQEFMKQHHKYQQLFERDRKMQVFIDAFDENMQAINQEMQRLRDDNVGLLRHISEKEIGDERDSALQVDEMRQDISFKEQQKSDAQNTLVYSKKELEKRQAELEKINNLDEKISAELENIEKKQSECEEEMKSFKSQSEVLEEYQQRKQELFKLKMELQQKKEMVEKKVLEVAQRSDQINRKLNENAYHNELKDMESKIQKLSQNIFSVEHSIAEYKREGEYHTISNQVLQIQQEINVLLLRELEIET